MAVEALLADYGQLAGEVRKALRGMAAGSATVMHPGTDLCRREDVDRLHAELLGRGRP